MFNNILSIFKFKFEKKNIEFKVEVDKQFENIQIKTDQQRLS